MTIKRNFGKILLTSTLVLAMGVSACNQKPTATSSIGKGQTEYEISTDIPVGSKDAKVVIVEYASIMCPHCATFQANVVPQIMKNYVETGKVRYVFREFPTPPIDLASAGHLMGRCVDPSKREALVNALMSQQKEIYMSSQAGGGAKEAFMKVAQSAGMNEAAFDACMKDSKKLKDLVDIRNYAIEHDKVEATPTVFVNGVQVKPPVGREYEFVDVQKAVDAALATTK